MKESKNKMDAVRCPNDISYKNIKERLRYIITVANYSSILSIRYRLTEFLSYIFKFPNHLKGSISCKKHRFCWNKSDVFSEFDENSDFGTFLH